MGTERGSDRFELVAFHDVETPDDFGDLRSSALDLARTTFGAVESEHRIHAHLSADFVALGVDRTTRRVLGLTLLRLRSLDELDDARQAALQHLAPDTTIGYLHGSAVRRDAQGTGLYRALNRRRIDEVIGRRITSVVTTTQNPKVESGLVSLFDHLLEAGVVTAWRLERSVLRGIYGQLLTAHQPPSRGTPFEVLDRDAGDAFALLFTVAYP